ncbi:MAG: mechanosensitive ion channel family protein [Treponema sp.]|jgi:small conductance mechanosensitive channel|nr:mechanosensitive ion channel family protein [Treponema sp.]
MKNELLNLWQNHSGAVIELAKDALVSAAIIIAGVALSRAARKLIGRAVARGLYMDETVGSLLRAVIRYAVFIICVIMILNIFGVNTASLIALLGAAGVAVGLALKDTLGNIAAGIILLFLGSYRRGDYIECGSFSGAVKDISLFTTTLETPDGIFISAPNSCVWGSPLKNYTRNGRRRMELSVCIAYSDPVDTAFQVMRDIIAAESRFLKDPAPQVILRSLNDSSITITIRAWAANQVYWDIYWEQMRNIKAKIEEAGLHIPFPQQDVRIIAKSNEQ